jgi:uncharacterized protein (DUF1778 family)
MSSRTSLLLNCSKYEAEEIRSRAKTQRRTVSGYVLNIIMRAVDFDAQILLRVNRLQPTVREKPEQPRTTIHLHCSTAEAKRVRDAAKRRENHISDFILHALRRSWSASDSLLQPKPN